MESETKTIKARCLCGAIRYDITLPSSAYPLLAGICHCDSCRRTTGAPALTIANTPPSWAPSRELLDSLVPFEFSKRLKQYHCGTCGSYMMTHCVQDPNDLSKGQNWDVGCGTLEQADSSVYYFAYHEYLADTLDGGFADFLVSIDGKTIPRMSQNPKTSEQLPLHWQSKSRSQIEPSPSDKLHCHCKCGGVEFWISRASERSKKALDNSGWWLRDNGTKFLSGLCCCNSCRLGTGQEIHSWAFIPTIDISLDANGEEKFTLPFGTLQSYRTSSEVTRYFCNKCAATVFMASSNRKDLINVALGMLDAAEGVRAESWIELETQRLGFREDAISRTEKLVLALEEGLKEFSERKK